jgi:copper homeostasis protein
MRQIIFELCAETIDGCLAAREGGAHRIELCSALSEGGLTPSNGLIRAAVERSGLPIHVMIRPRSGGFQYDEVEIDLMKDDILHAKQFGAAGVVLGILRQDSSVDIEGMGSLVLLARPMKVTFHRAFDETPSLSQSLEDVIATGAHRVLTSGGQRNAVAGGAALAELVSQANGRIEIAVGGGLRLRNAASLARLTGAEHFHGSLRQRGIKASHSTVEANRAAPYRVDANMIRSVIRLLQNA